MKKALIVSNSSGLVTIFLKNDIELLIEMGYQIDCACNTKYPGLNTDQFFEQYQIRVEHIDFPIRTLDIKLIHSSYKRLKKLIKEGNYSLVHCHSTIVAALARQCAKSERRKGIKVIYTSHGFPFYEGAINQKIPIYKMIERYYSSFTDGLITICNEDYENAKKLHCKNLYKINGVGVDIAKFNFTNFDKNKYREKLGFDKEDKVILSIGELNTNKNHQVIIKAIALMKDKKIVYAICGREITDIGKKQELYDLAKELGVKLVLLGFRSDIPQICHSVEIGALPSFKEGLGLSGIEMLACGIPVVGSKRQGIKDYVIDGKTGYMCNPNSPKSFAQGIRKTFELAHDMNTKKNCISISRQYSIEDSRAKMKIIYQELLAE